MQPKFSNFNDRQASSAAAKQALLQKFKPKPMVQADTPIDHEAERRARIEEVRKQREEEKLARQAEREAKAAAEEQARLEAEAAAAQAALDSQLSVDAQKRAERKERKKAIKEAAKAKKEARATERPVSANSRASDDREIDPIKEHERYIRSLERDRPRMRA